MPEPTSLRYGKMLGMRSAAVVLGGAIGTLSRWGIDEFVVAEGLSFPLATFAVNISGAFLLGIAGVVLIERMAGAEHLRAFLLIGLLGSYTTFSAMAMEGVLLIEEGDVAIAAAYWIATLVAGQAAGVSGIWLGRVRT